MKVKRQVMSLEEGQELFGELVAAHAARRQMHGSQQRLDHSVDTSGLSPTVK